MFLAGLSLVGPIWLAYQRDPYWTVVAWATVVAFAYFWRNRGWILPPIMLRANQNPVWVIMLVAMLVLITLESTAVETAIYFVTIAMS